MHVGTFTWKELMTEDSWAEQRRKNAAARSDLLRRQAEAESQTASAYLRAFAAGARAAGLQPEPLVVTKPGTSRKARTPITGWYLKEDRSVGVDEDGNFYLLTAPLSLMESLRGVAPEPSAPPLVLGKGGRDGESVDLIDALTKRVPNWRAFER